MVINYNNNNSNNNTNNNNDDDNNDNNNLHAFQLIVHGHCWVQSARCELQTHVMVYHHLHQSCCK